MDSKQIEQRLGELENQRTLAFRALEKAKLQVAAVDGAIQESQHWLRHAQEEESKKVDVPKEVEAPSLVAAFESEYAQPSSVDDDTPF